MNAIAEKARVERDYDALIEQLHAVQAELGNKAAKAAELPLDDYRLWFATRKREVAQLQQMIAAKKAERAEARRHANNWQPSKTKTKDWLNSPNCRGFWWYYGPLDHEDVGFDVIEIFTDDEGELVMEDDGAQVSPKSLDAQWLRIPMPEAPK